MAGRFQLQKSGPSSRLSPDPKSAAGIFANQKRSLPMFDPAKQNKSKQNRTERIFTDSLLRFFSSKTFRIFFSLPLFLPKFDFLKTFSPVPLTHFGFGFRLHIIPHKMPQQHLINSSANFFFCGHSH